MRRKTKKSEEYETRLYSILSIYAVGIDNAKTSTFIRKKYLEMYGNSITKQKVKYYLQKHPRYGSTRGEWGGYYLITSKAEAQVFYEQLYKHAVTVFAHAESVKSEFNL